mmetsp:Transcript_17569/g.36222  ORF Transcript_17569/g.36222 Transcript_17569/m.36222 type:complete len:235 (-) Transcript_17569:2004-2708(-)
MWMKFSLHPFGSQRNAVPFCSTSYFFGLSQLSGSSQSSALLQISNDFCEYFITETFHLSCLANGHFSRLIPNKESVLAFSTSSTQRRNLGYVFSVDHQISDNHFSRRWIQAPKTDFAVDVTGHCNNSLILPFGTVCGNRATWSCTKGIFGAEKISIHIKDRQMSAHQRHSVSILLVYRYRGGGQNLRSGHAIRIILLLEYMPKSSNKCQRSKIPQNDTTLCATRDNRSKNGTDI